MKNKILLKAKKYSEMIVNELNGNGIYGVEFFVKGEELYFNEISPRPHDTGFVTLISQNYSEFQLHIRSVLDLPINKIVQKGPSASLAIIGESDSEVEDIIYHNIEKVTNDSIIRLFGKQGIKKRRRLGIILSKSKTIEDALRICKESEKKLYIEYINKCK